MGSLRARVVRWVSRLVARTPRPRLERLLRGGPGRRMFLGLVFFAMPRAVRRKALERERVVIGWRITGRPDGRADIRQLVIENGAARVLEGEPREADLEIELAAADLLLVATGNANPPAMYVRGDLHIEGDPWLAMRLPRIFAR